MSAREKPSKAKRDERAFLEAYDAGAYDRPSVAVDVAILGIRNDELLVLAVARAEPPFEGDLALPGGFLRLDESLDAAAERVLAEKAGLADVFLEQLYTFGEVARDPRTRVIAVAYYALVDGERLHRATQASGATAVRIRAAADDTIVLRCEKNGTVRLAFDHEAIVATALRRIRGKLDYAPIGYELLPGTFTLLQLQRVHETVAGRPLNKDSFRRRMLASGALEPTDAQQSDVGHRPATLYRYVASKRS